MPALQRCYVLAFQSDPRRRPQRLELLEDVNAATVAAHAAWRRLRGQGRAGEVLLLRQDQDEAVVLRLPLVSRPTRLPRRRSATPATANGTRVHAGWSLLDR